jgi:hypothetical protein
MTTDAAPYVIRHYSKGLMAWVVKQSLKQLKVGQPAPDALAIVDSEGVH